MLHTHPGMMLAVMVQRVQRQYSGTGGDCPKQHGAKRGAKRHEMWKLKGAWVGAALVR